MCNSIRMELYKIFRMRSFWVISIIMIGLVFMTTEFNCDDMKAARQEQSAAGNISGQKQSTSEGNVSGQQKMAEMQHTMAMVEYKCWYYETAKAAGTVEVPQNMKEPDVPKQFQDIRRELKNTVIKL